MRVGIKLDLLYTHLSVTSLKNDLFLNSDRGIHKNYDFRRHERDLTFMDFRPEMLRQQKYNLAREDLALAKSWTLNKMTLFSFGLLFGLNTTGI